MFYIQLENFQDSYFPKSHDFILPLTKLRYSKEHGEISLLAACIGIPIIQNKKVITAISVTIPISKFTEEYQQYIVNLLKETKSELESIINI